MLNAFVMAKLFLLILFCGGFSLAEANSVRIDFEDLRGTITNSTVIVFGENHEALIDKQYFPQITQEIQRIDPAYNCLSLELSSTLQGEFYKINGPSDYN